MDPPGPLDAARPPSRPPSSQLGETRGQLQ
jgi:hypothetical protein